MQSVMARWIACDELTEADWNTIRFIASVNLSPHLQEHVKGELRRVAMTALSEITASVCCKLFAGLLLETLDTYTCMV